MWKTIAFEKCLTKVQTPYKVPKNSYLAHGDFPVVSQEASLISGYHNEAKHVVKISKPVVIFGDHTRVLKYIDFDFVVGADGVKILQTIDDIDTKFFLYILKLLMPKSKGYARHYRLLKDLRIPIPPLAEQQRIVAKVDEAFAEIDRAANLTKVRESEIEKLRVSLLDSLLKSNSKLHNLVKLRDVCQILNGGTPKSNVKDYWDGDIQWLTPKDMGRLHGKYVNSTERKITTSGLNNSSAKLVPSQSVILSCRAPIGHVLINSVEMSFNQGCKALVPSTKLDIEYLYYFIYSSKQLLNDLGTGTTFKEISSKTLGDVEMPLPSIDEQRQIVSLLNKGFDEIERILSTTASSINNYAALKGVILKKELNPSEAA